jgi:P-type Ca2+ transporter type 2C
MVDAYRQTATEALAELKSNRETGLTKSEAAARIAQYGPNTLPAGEGTNFVKLLFEQFTDVMVIMLIIAAGISLFLGETVDFIVIVIIVVLNAALGVYQEFRAEQALAALSAMQVPLVRVRRDGEVHQISATELVPGDIVLLEEGDSVPADGRIIESINLRIEEAALTGESVPVDKTSSPLPGEGNVGVGDRTNMAFMGTAVTYGRGTLLVTDTALKTEIGKIAGMLMGVEEGTTPLQRRLNQLGRTLASGAIVVVIVVFIAGLARGIPAQDMFLIAVSLAVAAVPEGLPALVTIGLSLGASRMVKRHALIRRLPAVETLGSVTTICSDKTGTLTRNEMTATYMAFPGRDYVNIKGIGYNTRGEFVTESGGAFDPKEDDTVERLLKAMALSTNAHLEPIGGKKSDEYHVVGDTTEGALMVAAQKVGWTRRYLEESMPRIGELPFSSDRKAMTTVHDIVGEEDRHLFGTPQYVSITKGAPDQLLMRAAEEQYPDGRRPMTEERRQRWQERIDGMASQGLRVLGIGYRVLENAPQGDLTEDIEDNLIMIGLVGIVDPARPEAREAVRTAKNAGIRSIMITGDHALTAEAIARDLGIITPDQKAITGAQLDAMGDANLKAALKTTSCFARVSPAHKLQIVKALQEEGQVVAMTGDGVNDAPALKQADIGVAMGITGTEVSKGAAEMVLTDDNFASIVSAVEEGRAIYDNIKKFIKYLLSSNIGEIFVMFTALIVGMKVPLLAIQILWINLVTDGLPAIALGFEPAEKTVMQRKPRNVDESIFAGGTGRYIMWVGVLITILTLGGYLWGYASHNMDPLSNTLGLEKLNSTEIADLIEKSGEHHVTLPANWDSLSMDEKSQLLNGRVETLSSADAVFFVGENKTLPADWDSMTVEQRAAFLGHEAEGAAARFEGGDNEVISAVERIPRTIAFTVLAFTQMFSVMSIHAGTRTSFFRVWFSSNPLLFWSIVSTFVLQLLVIYVPFLQDAFRTAPLNPAEIFSSFLLGAVVLFAAEIEKSLLSGRPEQDPDLAPAT